MLVKWASQAPGSLPARGVTVLLATIKVFAVISAVALGVIAMCFYAYDGSESDQW
jgi:hypothetical protein